MHGSRSHASVPGAAACSRLGACCAASRCAKEARIRCQSGSGSCGATAMAPRVTPTESTQAHARTRRELRPGAQENQPGKRGANHSKPAILQATIAQNIAWNERLRFLCRRCPCANQAPGQPHSRAKPCNLLSGVRRRPSCAARLSCQYAIYVARLIAP